MLTDLGGIWAVEPTRFAAILAAIAAGRTAATPTPPVRSEMVAAKNGRSVAVIPVTGLLTKAGGYWGTSTVQTRRAVRQAAADPNVSAVLLTIDSPGGSVAGTADLASDVKAARKAKPVWAHIDDLGASAAYWIASQADQVFAGNPTALVGSIGAVMAMMDLSGAAEKAGVKTRVFATGPLKGAGTPGTAITDEQAAYFQALVDDAQVHFDAAVKAGRGLTATQLAAVRTGGVFGATEAHRLHLIDGIRPLDATISALSKAR